MARFELKLPKMGESVAEATITSWLKEVGETIDMDDAVVEVATDKVDSEVPSEVDGKLIEILFGKDEIVKVGQTIAIIETEGEQEVVINIAPQSQSETIESVTEVKKTITTAQETISSNSNLSERFYTPLVRNIAQKEGVSIAELDAIAGSGKGGRVTKTDILSYVIKKGSEKPLNLEQQANIKHESIIKELQVKEETPVINKDVSIQKEETTIKSLEINSSDEIVELSRMGKIIAKHMVDSSQTSVHVQSFIEIDVTNIVTWRNKVKDEFFKREGEKLTYTPIFMQAVAQTIKQYPLINISFDGEKIIKRGNVNLGMAAALPSGDLIVPVIKNADRLNLVGITKEVNDLATRARANKLKPDDVKGGTYTVTNVGGFGSITGTPIINQPQVAILALGAIVKKPAVIESEEGDFIGIRHKMIVAHAYDHRVVNGALGGMFIKTLKDILESWNVNTTF